MSLSSVSRVSNVSHWEENAPERMWGWEHACAYLAAKLAAEYASKYARGCWKKMLVIGVISLCAWMADIESGLTKALTKHNLLCGCGEGEWATEVEEGHQDSTCAD